MRANPRCTALSVKPTNGNGSLDSRMCMGRVCSDDDERVHHEIYMTMTCKFEIFIDRTIPLTNFKTYTLGTVKDQN